MSTDHVRRGDNRKQIAGCQVAEKTTEEEQRWRKVKPEILCFGRRRCGAVSSENKDQKLLYFIMRAELSAVCFLLEKESHDRSVTNQDRSHFD